MKFNDNDLMKWFYSNFGDHEITVTYFTVNEDNEIERISDPKTFKPEVKKNKPGRKPKPHRVTDTCVEPEACF